VQRIDVKVAGGNFKVDPYETWDGDPGNDTDKNAGLKFEVLYTPAKDVVFDKVGVVQIMKCIKGDASPLLSDNEKRRDRRPAGLAVGCLGGVLRRRSVQAAAAGPEEDHDARRVVGVEPVELRIDDPSSMPAGAVGDV
jgi:hypothetical protein